ncbi:Rpn family recombination-promoting nuclease/putative transposase [uncultured Phascolarctobacterium sp.]|uniref:Rpn family recombination-promoting nuclease/putative transposase n=1 Tax=uncultured Phascolarctobacterium sp. TaxID=512296 RepID=UPI0025DD45EE|nr:Rpn family recombination-promoting nuclease/putative transposase [uncultured Phascolarctobacterium sp.]
MQTNEASQESEIKQVIRSLCMMNNRFMNFMLDDNKEAAQVFLRVILGDDKIKVRNVRIQSFIQNIYGHSSQLDILAQDSKGRYFNVEVQRSDEGAPARRARFYSSILDTHFLQPSKLYEELPDTYVIFITENDVLHDNLPLYNIRRRIDENAKYFEDGSHIIYVNSQRRDDTALGKLMQDLYCTEPKNLHYHEFAERMEFLKYSKEGEEKMTDVIEEYAARKAEALAKEAAREAVKEAVKEATKEAAKKAEEKEQANRIELAQGLLADGMSIEFTVRHSKLTEAEVRELASKLTA